MQRTFSKVTLRISVLLVLLLVAAVALSGSAVPLVSSWANPNTKSAVKVTAPSATYIRLQEARELEAVYVEARAGKDTLQAASTHAHGLPRQARPLSLASGDLNVDGFADLVCGYSTPSGGILTVHRGDPEAFAPVNPDVLRGIANNQFPEPFLKDATVIELPEAPDFLGVGDFNRDGRMDLIAAARNSNALYLLAGDGAGGFSIRRIELPGTVTAMVTGEINQSDGAIDVVVAVSTPAGPSVLVYETARSLEEAVPVSHSLPAEAKSLALGRLDDDRLIDLAIVAGGQVLVLHGSDNSGANPTDNQRAGELETIDLPFSVNALALGEFIVDRDSRTEMAVSDTDGTVHVLSRGELDTRPMTAPEILAGRQKLARLRDEAIKANIKGLPVVTEPAAPRASLKWQIAEDLQGPDSDPSLTSSAGSGGASSQPVLFSTRISALPSDDLVVMNHATRQLQIVYKEGPKRDDMQVAAKSVGRSSVSFGADGEIVAALPMRMNVDGRPGLVVMSSGKEAPSFFMPMSASTFTVTRADDPSPNGCLAGDCSLREAVIAANANPGADTIVFNAGINPTLSIPSGGGAENAAATGDLDIEDSVTITGNNQTVISTSYTAACGDCKVFGVAQNGTSGLTVSFSGVTIQNGFNNGAAFAGSFFDTAGGVDFFLSGSGNTYSMTNCVITNNKTTGSFLSHGGGVNVDSFNTASVGGPSAGTATFTGCTFSSNAADVEGGGLNLFADIHDVNVSNCAVSNNQTTGVGGGSSGGGINIGHSFGGTVTVSGGSVSNNTAAGTGGGINITFNPNVSISNVTVSGNTSTNGGGGSAHGGGVAIVTTGVAGFTPAISLSNVIISTNHADSGAVAQGGGVYFNSFYGATLSNCTVSSNTSKSGAGILNGGSAATPQATLTVNGGSITSNAASVSGGGVASLSAKTTITNVNIASNSATTSGGGLFVSGGALTATLCRIAGNTAPTGSGITRSIGTGIATVENNWWGCDGFPGDAGCQTGSGVFDANPRIDLRLLPVSATLQPGGTQTFTADVSQNSDGVSINPVVLNGLTITFTNTPATLGTVSPASAVLSGLTASTTFTANPTCPTPNTGTVSATLDNGTQSSAVTVEQPLALSACPANQTVGSDPGQCGASVSFTPPVATAGCPTPTVTCRIGSTPITSPHSFLVGTTTVTCTASNGVSPDASCSFTVTVNDTQPPTVTCPAPMTVNTASGQCSAFVAYTTPTGNDNCPGVTVSCSPPSGTTFNHGPTTVTCTATDAAGLTGNCSFTVTVVDNQPPTIGPCPASGTTNTDPGQCSAVVNYTTPTATDNCPGVTVACNPPSGTAFPKGTTTVTCTATDGSNTTSCTFTVTVNDNQPPTLGACPSPITTNTDAGQCSAFVTYTPPTVSDNCPGAGVACNPASGSTFLKGTTTVTCTATDAAGLHATCSFTVTVNDNQSPTISCPANITTNTAAGQCSAVVSYTVPAPNDNCPGATASCSPPSGSTFNKGTTTVTCTATDAVALTGTCTFTVTVVDNQAPTIGACPSPITTNTSAGQCSAVVTYTTPTSSDNCPGQTVACNPPSGGAFPKGTTTVTCTATDTASLVASCSFTVTVTDNQAPSITCPGNINAVENSPGCATVTYATPTPSDNCPGATASCSPPSGFCFPIGSTTVTCTATDTSSNTASCTFHVNVVVACTINCPANITTGNTPGQCGAIVNYPSPAATAGCGTVTCTPASGSFFPKGTTSVNCTTTAGPNCSFTVTVFDNQPPTIVCPANVSATAPNGQTSTIVNYPAPTVTDNCPGASAVCSPPSGSTFSLGVTTVTCTATDASANHSACTFKVAVSGTLIATGDSYVRQLASDTNEGGNDRLRLTNIGNNRALAKFNLSGVSTSGLQSATLRLNIAGTPLFWGLNGRPVDAQRILVDWTEGNGINDLVGFLQGFRGTGEGVTWDCAKDANIANFISDCGTQWNGGTFAPATSPSSIHTNAQTGSVSWNVTADVQAGANNGWLIKKKNESQNGEVQYYSREGATLAGNQNLAPRLVLVYQP